MATKDSIAWFKQNFGAEINEAVKGTPFDLDMLTAIAFQETGSIWGVLRTKGLTRERILELCVGDTLDRTKTFPKNKADLVAWPRGDEMFAIARAALIDMSANIPGYAGMVAIPTKFCHGYGLFQYDIQFFKTDPDYFLERRYIHFNYTLGRCLSELKTKLAKVGGQLGWAPNRTLSDADKAAVAIAYNTGGYNPAKGLKQGHYDKKADKYYGQFFAEFLAAAKAVPMPFPLPPPAPAPEPAPPPPPPPPPAPTPGAAMTVNVTKDPLNLRSKPEKGDNVVGKLPDGLAVRAFEAKNGFLRVTATLAGKAIEGWASAEFLKAVVVTPPPPPPPPPGDAMVVDVTRDPLNLRSKPEKGDNVVGKLPDGLPVRAFETKNGFRRVTAILIGKAVEGWVSTEFLKKA